MASLKMLGLRAYRRAMRANEKRLKEALRKKLKLGADAVRKSVRGQLGGRMSDDDRQRVDRGNKLGTYTGRLKGSISVSLRVRSRSSWRAEIGPKGQPGVYGLVHELGLGPYPARPFLGPAVEDTAEKVYRLLGESLRVLR